MRSIVKTNFVNITWVTIPTVITGVTMKKLLLVVCFLITSTTVVQADRWKHDTFLDNSLRSKYTQVTDWFNATVVQKVWNDLKAQGVIMPWSHIQPTYNPNVCTNADGCFDLDYKHEEWNEYCFMQKRMGRRSVSGMDATEEEYSYYTYRCLTRDEYVREEGEEPPIRTSGSKPEEWPWKDPDDPRPKRLMGWTSHQSTSCTRAITINNSIFERGYYDMDPDGLTLRHGRYRRPPAYDPHRLYYRYALDCEEAVTYVLLHEYAHYMGMFSQGTADEYARSTIIELRKRKLGRRYTIRKFDHTSYTDECQPSSQVRATMDYNGQSPPSNDMPPGSVRD
jgi:hypothetical protein